jgi:hypothetical protein
MNKTKKLLSLFLLVLYVTFYAGTVLFFHTHIINGEPTTHSHIHKESHHDSKSGGHTKQDLIFIAQISHFDYVNFECSNIPNSFEFQLHENIIFETTHWVASIYFDNISLRAPPAA